VKRDQTKAADLARQLLAALAQESADEDIDEESIRELARRDAEELRRARRR
jgi:hypothetical protein